jgi:micrococcal nuclease
VIDGDTIALANGLRVRLVQIDTPEPGTGECFSRAAGRELRALLPAGAAVALEADPRLDRVDRYGRLLRYVHRGELNLNLELVRRGAATVWFYDGDRGRYAARLLSAATAARKARRGLWGACPAAVWDPYGPATTGPGSPPPTAARARPAVGGTRCDPSYPTVCIPPPPPDLDCRDVPFRNFPVRPPDPHHFDGGGDGLGCERA